MRGEAGKAIGIGTIASFVGGTIGVLIMAFMAPQITNAVDGDANKLGFSIANARKDLGYYSNMVDGLDVPSFISPATRHALTLAVAQGYGDKDVPVMVDFFEYAFKPA